MKDSLLALVGAALGGIVGYCAFFWIEHQGFYALALPGGLLGLGAAWRPNRSLAVAIVCGVAALTLGIFTEWMYRPFKADHSFAYFVTHVWQLKPLTLLIIAIGTAVGFWVPFRSVKPSVRRD